MNCFIVESASTITSRPVRRISTGVDSGELKLDFETPTMSIRGDNDRDFPRPSNSRKVLTNDPEEIGFSIVEMNDMIATLERDVSQVDGHFGSKGCRDAYASCSDAGAPPELPSPTIPCFKPHRAPEKCRDARNSGHLLSAAIRVDSPR